ncbi:MULTISPECIES: hypothetical protein [unclassified Achromobacter]|uniref:hypothetical protein n=1 Tax=unclassified Achromobacter TaxID=2626865 RepID=UPI000B51DD7B|nr:MULTISPECIES: hypothetical protein [unclassified Achromobacter]OWT75510.1 hypothetical protein CEY04_18175 [Achromobacter sp. HZ28]OWT76170.1 hypothetical protein CEY05_13625 [Achromobacter sp. HZ34]
MKKTDLEKNKALKLQGQLKNAGTPQRFGTAAAQVPDRRDRRRLDQAQGLVSFPVKLPQTLADQLRALAVERGTGVNEVTAELLEAALAAGASQSA